MSTGRPRLLMAAAGMVVASAATALAAEPRKLWEAGNFKNPESAVYDPAAGVIYVSNVNGDPMVKDGTLVAYHVD